jgi:hypothetical protein
MTNDDMNRFVKELAHKIKTGEPSSSRGGRVWDVTESDIDLLQAKLHQELYAPQQDTSIDFTEWMQNKKGK